MRKHEKTLMSMALVGAMTISLAACGGNGASNNGGKGENATPVTSSDENTLTVYAWDKGFNIPALEAAYQDYKKNVNPDFKLEIIEQAGAGDVETAITTAASAGNYETLPDIVLFQDHWIQRYVKDYPDAWVDVDDVDVNWDDFAQEKLSYSIIDGKHYGFPVDNSVVMAAYRVDLLKEAGYTIDDLTGITWDKFIQIGEDVYNKTGKYLCSMNSDGNDLPYMMLQAEGESMFKDGKPYITENEKLVKIIEILNEMTKKNVLYLANNWSDYTDQTIVGDMVAGVLQANWMIPTMKQVEANSGKWEITTLPTIDGKEGYATNGGSGLYITANCKKVDLAKDFLSKTFGGSKETYDGALKNGGVITSCISAGQSEVYQDGVEFFNNTPAYEKLVEMSTKVPIIEQNDFHYTCQQKLSAAIIQIKDGADIQTALKDVEDQLNFEMGN